MILRKPIIESFDFQAHCIQLFNLYTIKKKLHIPTKNKIIGIFHRLLDFVLPSSGDTKHFFLIHVLLDSSNSLTLIIPYSIRKKTFTTDNKMVTCQLKTKFATTLFCYLAGFSTKSGDTK